MENKRPYVEDTCPCCGGTDFWTRRDGAMVCKRCHPEPTGREENIDPVQNFAQGKTRNKVAETIGVKENE